MTERKYPVDDGEVTVILPDGYSAATVEDLIRFLELDLAIQNRKEAELPGNAEDA